MKRVIGIDIGGSHIAAGVVKNGKIEKIAQVKTPNSRKCFLEALCSAVSRIIDKRIKKIGIGFPSPVLNGKINEVNNITFMSGFNLNMFIERKFNVKCFSTNDANAFILGELKYGAAKGAKSAVGITLGTGIGSGIIIDGKLYEGSSGCAGEIGINPWKGKELEESANAGFIRIKTGKDSWDVPSKHPVWKDYGKNLGVVISYLANVIDPEIIVIGGGVAERYSCFRKYMEAEIRKNIYAHAFRKIKIKKAKLSEPAVIGAAELCI